MAEKIIAFILLVLIIRFLLKIIMIPFRFVAGLFSGPRGSGSPGYGITGHGGSGRRAVSSGIACSSYRRDPEEEYYADLHEMYYGSRPARPLTEDEKIEL